MKTISEQLIQLNQIKSDIKQAIIAKGVQVAETDGLAVYASKIAEISGGNVVLPNGICFTSSLFSALPGFIQDADWSDVKYMEYMFSYCRNLTSVSLVSLSNVTYMYGAFSMCSRLSSVTLSGLSQVTYMSRCFAYDSALTDVNLDGLDKVGDIGECFAYCSALKTIELQGLSNVTDMGSCFRGCRSLTSITLSGLSKMTSIYNCFSGCTSLQHLSVDSFGTVITNLTNWAISVCTRLTHDSLVNLINALYTTNVTRTCTIGTTNLAKLSSDEIAIATSKGWTLN